MENLTLTGHIESKQNHWFYKTIGKKKSRHKVASTAESDKKKLWRAMTAHILQRHGTKRCDKIKGHVL